MINRVTALAALTLFIFASSCASFNTHGDTRSFGVVRPFEPHAAEFAGIWRTDGYGYIYEIGETDLKAFHATATTCVEMSDEDAADTLSYNHVRVSRDGSVMRLSIEHIPYEYQAHRINALPTTCLDPTPDTPIGNFEAFTSYFTEHYAFFDLYDVDWSAEIAVARPQITPEMGDRTLFDFLAGMLAEVEDGHVRMIGQIDGERALFRIGQGRTLTALNAHAERSGLSPRTARRNFDHHYWVDGIQEMVLKGKGVLAGNDRIRYGIAFGDIGYLTFLAEGGFSDAGFGGSHLEELPVLNAVLDDAIALFELQHVKAVIVDVSNNYGGYDFIARAIAGRFAAHRVPAYSKHAIDNPGAEPFTLYIEPAAGRRFTGPVYVLTSGITGSAGETLTLSLRALPNVTHVGEPTKGTLSDVLVKTLPNGWTVTLSNEIYTDIDGIVWEGDGIEPEVEIRIFDTASPFDGHPEAIRALVELINERLD